jgi:hypothetical protein
MPSTNPFDLHASLVNQIGFHNHRVNTHSDIISDGIISDLKLASKSFSSDLESKRIAPFKNQPNPWGRGRNTDLIIAKPLDKSQPLSSHIRVIMEHKSVITAHRNRDARHDDLFNICQEASADPQIVLAGTVMIGLCEKVLNIPDHIRKTYKLPKISKSGRQMSEYNEARFENEILSRVRNHDQKLWDDFQYAISYNTPGDIRQTLSKFRTLPIRQKGDPDSIGFDALLLVPVYYNNVDPARVARDNTLGMEVDKDYAAFIQAIAAAYEDRYGNQGK